MAYSNANVIKNKEIAKHIVDVKSELNKIIGEMTAIQDVVVYDVAHPERNTTEPAQDYGLELTSAQKTRRYDMYQGKLNTILTGIKALTLP